MSDWPPRPPYLPEGRGLDYVDRHYSHSAQLAWGLALVSRCMKLKTGAVIARGLHILGSGTNDVEYPPQVCPRAKLPTGVGYELCGPCKQRGHAEMDAIANAHERAAVSNRECDLTGAHLYLAGHWWVCKDCWDAIIREGITRVFIVVDQIPRVGEAPKESLINR